MGKESADARSIADGRLASTRYPTQHRLIAAIRRGEEPAIHELFVLYAPLLRDQAKKMSLPRDELNQLVDTLLDDIVMHLVEMEIPPRELTTYMITALRNRVRSRHRSVARARQTDENAYSEHGDSAEKIVAECHSEYGVRATLPPDAELQAPLRSAIRKLADKSASELSPDELILMIGVSRHIPLRDLGEQLGVSHGAVRVRLSRLRERFVRLAIQYVRTLAPDEKRELRRFFRRADIRLDSPSTNWDNGGRETGRKNHPSQE